MVSDPHALNDGLAGLEAVRGRRLAVVGDAMLDRFVRGVVDRISPEAPVPVVHVRDELERLGGAANVAANLAALGAVPVLFSVAGDGEAADHLDAALAAAGISGAGLVRCPDRHTAEKTRILGGGQQIVRIDRETVAPLREATRERLLDSLRAQGPFDGIVVSDYGKGVIGLELMEQLRAWHDQGTIVVVDPKQGNFELYRGITAITPNQREAAAASHESIDDDADAARVGEALRLRLENDMLLLTRGENGMSLLEGGGTVHHIPTEARDVFDVTGAGDTVISVFTAMLAAGAAPVLAARLSNVAAGLAVRELGTAAIAADALVDAWRHRCGGEL